MYKERRMKNSSFIVLLLTSFYTQLGYSFTFDLVGPCSPKPVFHTQINLISVPQTLGQATVAILKQNRIPFDGSQEGIRSILNTPTGDDALEIISDSEMRAYGWCVTIDGRMPKLMPDQIQLKGTEHVLWFYGFSHYVAGKWISMCEPAFKVRPASLCQRSSRL
jgi:hypothetical protein